MGRENEKKKNLLLFGDEFKNGGGEDISPPPKGPEKSLLSLPIMANVLFPVSCISLAQLISCVTFLVLLFPAVPSAPATMLQGRAVNATAVQLSWQPPPMDEQNGIIRTYTVVLRETQTGRTMVYNTTMSQITVGQLMPCMSYNWNVTPYTVGYGPVPRGYYSVNTQPILNGKFLIHVDVFLWCYIYTNKLS